MVLTFNGLKKEVFIQRDFYVFYSDHKRIDAPILGIPGGPTTSQSKTEETGGGTLPQQGTYNGDIDKGDNEYINYWKSKKREKK